MEPLDNAITLTGYLEQREAMYRRLLACFVEQRELLIVENEWEEISSRFLSLVDSSTQIQNEIENLQVQINMHDPDSSPAPVVLELISEIQKVVRSIQNALGRYSQSTGQNLKNVKNQQKVMNAYYHLQSREQVPLYFDEKK
ncbi:hypothetical protein AWM70_17135 [Paenibacillus yonginensis]|uniref:Flagellar protein FliT n=1 Tax=Paenibacillus yonginensis TaxID=1462996 RepID=A0A1B1N3T8_9BACL|nr:hypothetical protein [Paenibacillus yonginensis]ANS76093.1 hypothetical protein AWM70_17135 [Paenibacillus yonginensis]